MAEKTFADRDIIFTEGDMADMAYVIRSGEVDILKHGDSGEIKLATIKEKEVFGEMGLFDPASPRSATARAKGEVVVDIISSDELHEMVNQCPPRLMPIITSVFDRLRATNQRVQSKEQATALLESEFDKVIVSPDSETVQDMFQPIEMPIAHLPLKIGGYEQGIEVDRANTNHVKIASEGPPLMVSDTHCDIAIVDGKLYLRDLGSRFGTVVNDFPIGRGRGHYKVALQKGKNKVILGEKKRSPYHIIVECV